MKGFKKHFIFLLLLLLALVVSACSDNDSSSSSSNGSSSENGGDSSDIPGVTVDKIKVGHSAPQTGPVAIYDNVRKGMQAYFDYANENFGGANGRLIELIAYDDEYQPAKTLQNMQRLIEQDKVYAMVGPIGTGNINAAQDMLVEAGIPVVGLNTGANNFVEPPIETFFATTFNYKIESKMLIDFAVNKLNADKITILYQNDDFGINNLEFAREALEGYPEIEVVAEVPFLATDSDFSTHAQKVLDKETDAIIMFTTPAPAAQMRRELYNLNATDIPFIVNATGGADLNQFNVAGPEIWSGVITATNVTINPVTHMDYGAYYERITSEYTENEIGSLSMMGWSIAKIFVEAVNRAGDDLSWDNFIKQMETFDKWDETFFSEVTYTPEHRYGMTTLYIVEAKDRNFKLIEEAFYDPYTGEVTYQ